MNNNQDIKSRHGGKRKNAGRKKGSLEKLRAQSVLNAIYRESGKSLSQLIAQHYQECIDRGDWQAVREYEKTFISKFAADKLDVDHTTQGQSLRPIYNFPKNELPDWSPIYTLEDAKKD
jgi:hypothetical protein